MIVSTLFTLESNPATMEKPSPAVHPRARGEHDLDMLLPFRQPVHPRARGEHARSQPTRVGSDRFIPARAGNTRAGLRRRWMAGSSPRARGTRLDRDRRSRRVAVHPRARGEHAQSHDRGHPWLPVHPRARGEHVTSATRCASYHAGSSPRARGTPRHVPMATSRALGSSPRARGTLSIGVAVHGLRTVHPRARGEHGVVPRPSRYGVAVHPRARGEHS